jgi:hypothetical protein
MSCVFRPLPLLLGLSLLLNAAVVAGVVALAVSDRAADRVADRLNLATEEDVDAVATTADEATAALGELRGDRVTVADQLDRLRSRLQQVDSAVEAVRSDLAQLDFDSLAAGFDVDELRSDVDAMQSQLDGFCNWVNRAVLDSIGTDFYFTWANLRIQAC